MEAVTMSGSVDCPCIDSTAILSEHVDGNCAYSTRSPNRTCYPADYGAKSCQAHDLDVAPACQGGGSNRPRFCEETFCYVDFHKCKQSSQRMYRSNLFSSDVDLFYSYSTCNSSASFWLDFSTVTSLQDKKLTITIPTMHYHYFFKRDNGGNIIADGGPEYFDDDIPFVGSYVEYLQYILRDSGANLNFVSTSRGSFDAHPSGYTASVQDVQSGLSTMGLGDFWITPQRLNMTSFTIPLFSERILLWVKKPQVDTSFKSKVETTMMPFQWDLWGLMFGVIALVACLNLWFSKTNRWNTGERTISKSFRAGKWNVVTASHRLRTVMGTLADSFIASSLVFFVGALDSGPEASLPTKVLSFGYGFLVLVAVAAYTANLVTFLTAPPVGFYYETMEMAVKHKAKICVGAAMTPTQWPEANFVERNTDQEMLEAIDEGACDCLLQGLPTIRNSVVNMKGFCERQLVATKTEALSINIGFPADSDIVAAISYWMKQGQEAGVEIEDFNKEYQSPLACPLEVEVSSSDDDEMKRLSVSEMIFPFTVFFASAALAVLIKIWKIRYATKEKVKRGIAAGQTSWDRHGGLRLPKKRSWCSDEGGSEGGKIRSEACNDENSGDVWSENGEGDIESKRMSSAQINTHTNQEHASPSAEESRIVEKDKKGGTGHSEFTDGERTDGSWWNESGEGEIQTKRTSSVHWSTVIEQRHSSWNAQGKHVSANGQEDGENESLQNERERIMEEFLLSAQKAGEEVLRRAMDVNKRERKC